MARNKDEPQRDSQAKQRYSGLRIVRESESPISQMDLNQPAASAKAIKKPFKSKFAAMLDLLADEIEIEVKTINLL